MGLPPEVKYLFFDVFGTVVNVTDSLTHDLYWHATSTLQDPSKRLPESIRSKAASADWHAVALTWRQNYHDFVKAWLADDYAAAGTTKYLNLDEKNPDLLSATLKHHGLEGLWDEQDVRDVCQTWHNLDAYADSAEGLRVMREKGYKIGTLSDGNEALLQDLTTHNKLAWDAIYGGSTFAAYKPSPRMYVGAAKKVGLKPEECALVAAHLQDARAAWECGFSVVYVQRGVEERLSREAVESVRKAGWVDVWVEEGEGRGGLVEAAGRL